MDASENIVSDSDRIHQMGHRAFVGGNGMFWEEIGRLQYNYLLSAGLSPDHVLLDLACGSLRAGRLFINYLRPGNYIGFDKEIDLIILGVAAELGIDLFKERRPQFIVSDSFDFRQIHRKPDYIMAQSLFTHLSAKDIHDCLQSLRKIVDPHVICFATFFEASTSPRNPSASDSVACFEYEKNDLGTLVGLAGWRMIYIGDWNHPRHQKLIRLEAKQ
ncbi:MAG: class I SAM-dependent methyltransferase [Kiritimatiellae bacterium]|nr:class I SAM-dependent methyltransferase [Kiritimatiellia bacterium]MDD5521716.1 class I SAM-dependent methyltransferase [Kiritimatiellia bacterium]